MQYDTGQLIWTDAEGNWKRRVSLTGKSDGNHDGITLTIVTEGDKRFTAKLPRDEALALAGALKVMAENLHPFPSRE